MDPSYQSAILFDRDDDPPAPAYGGPIGPMPNVLGAVGAWVCWSLRSTWTDLPPGVYCRDGESVWLVPGTYAGD